VAYGVSELAAVGPEAKIMARSAKKWGLPNSRVAWFKDNGQAADWLKKKIKPYDRILVKGSRGMKMESIVRRLSGEVEA
jgi:UDP-N-acetylmuramyl pentapeptide synthase